MLLTDLGTSMYIKDKMATYKWVLKRSSPEIKTRCRSSSKKFLCLAWANVEM